MTFRRFARAAALALFAVLLVSGPAKAIDLQTDMGGFSGGQITGLRDTYGIETLQVHITDISTQATDWVVSHFAGTVTDWYCVLGAVITTANSTLTLNVNGAQPTTNGTLTVTGVGSSIGDIDSAAVSGSNVTIAVGEAISIGTSGASTTTAEEICTVVIDR